MFYTLCLRSGGGTRPRLDPGRAGEARLFLIVFRGIGILPTGMTVRLPSWLSMQTSFRPADVSIVGPMLLVAPRLTRAGRLLMLTLYRLRRANRKRYPIRLAVTLSVARLVVRSLDLGACVLLNRLGARPFTGRQSTLSPLLMVNTDYTPGEPCAQARFLVTGAALLGPLSL